MRFALLVGNGPSCLLVDRNRRNRRNRDAAVQAGVSVQLTVAKRVTRLGHADTLGSKLETRLAASGLGCKISISS